MTLAVTLPERSAPTMAHEAVRCGSRILRPPTLLREDQAPELRQPLVLCTANVARGDYTCGFTHDFPVDSQRSGHGQAHFTVAPATRPGWYMTVLEDCD
jgi:hypothetical protein